MKFNFITYIYGAHRANFETIDVKTKNLQSVFKRTGFTSEFELKSPASVRLNGTIQIIR